MEKYWKYVLSVSGKSNLFANETNEKHMETKKPLAHRHISVDCVVVGFDGSQLRVLLVRRAGEESGKKFHDMRLPGSLIYMDEDLDEARSGC